MNNLPQNFQAMLQEALAFHRAGRLSEAEAIYRQILRAEPNHPDALHYLGMLAHEAGESEIAVELLNKALKFKPGYVNAHNNLGTILKDQGKTAAAADSYRRALTLKPDYAVAHNNLGLALRELGKLDEAVVSFRNALAFMPDFVEASYNLGITFHDLGRREEEIACYLRAIELRPDFTDAYFSLGAILKDQGKLAEAAACYRQIIAFRPDCAEAHNYLGVALKEQGKPDEAIASFRQALERKPDYAEALNNLGNTLKDQGKLDGAVACYRRAVDLQPDLAPVHCNMGNALEEQGKLDEAAVCIGRCLDLNPEDPEAHYSLGVIFRQMGKMADAISSFRKALSYKPGHILAYKGLTSIVKYTEVDDVVHAMEDLYRKDKLPAEDRVNLGFALGKVFEDIGDYDKSFDYILAANRLKRGLHEYSLENDRDLFERIKKIFSPDFFAAHREAGNPDATPIFILGMPRSGTTLIEQILASHPRVFGAGELRILANLVGAVCQGQIIMQYPDCLPELGMNIFANLGADYLGKIREYSNEAERITDKMPHNFLHIGLIRVILPNARVVHCTRNAMDTCFSIFKKDFTGVHGYAYDLADLGRYYNLYLDLMAHWDKVLPGFIYNLRYEEMIEDQLNQTKNLLDFCGLPWDETCLVFHESKRKVSTASVGQVRQPIYRDSVKLWKRYERQLEPLRKAIYG